MEKPQEVDILDYLSVIWRRAWLIALLCILTAAVTLIISLLVGKVYETEITFRIMGQQGSSSSPLSQIPSSTLVALGVSSGEREIQTYSQVLRSRKIADQVIDALPYLMKSFPAWQKKGLSGKIKNMLKPYNREVQKEIGEDEFRRRLLLEKLRESIRIQQLGGDVLSARVRWEDPESTADIASEMGKALINYDRAARQEATDRTLGFIQRALRGTEAGEIAHPEDGVEQTLASAEQRLRDFKIQHKTVVMQEEARKLIEKLVDAEDALSSASINRRTSEARLADIQRQLAEQDQMVLSAQTVIDNPLVQYLQKEMVQLEIRAQSLGAGLGEANPELMDIENQIAEHEKRIREILKEDPRVVSQETTTANPLYQFLRQEEINCLINITISEAKELAMRERVAALEEKLMQMPDEEIQLAALTREIETYSRTYATLRQSESEALLARESITTNISVLDEPDIPLEAAAPKTALNTAIGGIVGLMLGFGLAFFLEYLKRIRG